jgi:hypothetical protein
MIIGYPAIVYYFPYLTIFMLRHGRDQRAISEENSAILNILDLFSFLVDLDLDAGKSADSIPVWTT